MPRSARSGLNVVRVKQRDGSIKEYCYDIKTKQFLGHDRKAAQALALGLKVEATDTIAGLIAFYKTTDAFKRLKPGTKANYINYLSQLEGMFGDLPASAIRPSTIEMIKQSLGSQPRRCNMILAMLRIILGLAVRLEYVTENIARKPGIVEERQRTEVWSIADESKFLDAARPSLRLAFLLLLYTLQRPSDVLEMKLDRISERDGRLFIAVQQGKTDALLDVPVHSRLEPLLREGMAEAGDNSGSIVGSPRGLMWARRNFSRAWDAARKQAGVSGVQRRDLRRTGIVRMAEAGATTPMIAAVSGHSIDYCQRIIDTYLPRRTEVAVQGIELWERAGTYRESKVVELAARRRKK